SGDGDRPLGARRVLHPEGVGGEEESPRRRGLSLPLPGTASRPKLLPSGGSPRVGGVPAQRGRLRAREGTPRARRAWSKEARPGAPCGRGGCRRDESSNKEAGTGGADGSQGDGRREGPAQASGRPGPRAAKDARRGEELRGNPDAAQRHAVRDRFHRDDTYGRKSRGVSAGRQG